MKYCNNCGKEIPDDQKLCEECKKAKNEKINNEINKNINLLAILAYLGLLFIVPLVVCDKNNKFVRFHVNQGIVLFIFSLVFNLLSVVVFFILPIIGYIIGAVESIFTLAFVIVGVVNVCKEETKPLPIIGKINIIK